jgi:hypothetical protein
VCLTRSWATATSGGSLLEGSRTLARGPTFARQPELVGDRIGTSLALQNQWSAGDRSLPGQRPKPCPKRLWTEVRGTAGSEVGPGGRDLANSLVARRHNDQFVPFRCSRRSSSPAPELESLGPATLPETPSEDGARLHNRSPRQAREPPARGGGLREAGHHPGARGLQPAEGR